MNIVAVMKQPTKSRKRESVSVHISVMEHARHTDRCEFKKQLKMEAVKMFYDMIKEFGKDFIGEWFMFSTMSVAGSVLIIACNVAGKF